MRLKLQTEARGPEHLHSLSYRNIEELMLERGVKVDHSAINRWVIFYAPLLENEFRKNKKKGQ